MANEDITTDKNYDEAWRAVFLQGNPDLMGLREDFMKFRATLRCRLCGTPFDGEGPLSGREPSSRNRNDCSACDTWIEQHHPGAVKAEFTVIAADIRGSTSLAHSVGSDEFQRRYEEPFFWAAVRALNDTDGYVADFRGDELRGVYPHGFSRGDHVRKAVEGARRLLQDIPPKTPEGAPIPFGIGVYEGDLTIGTSPRSGTFTRVAISGDGVNMCSRLSAEAGPGEALISEKVCRKAGLPIDKLERRLLTLKGIDEKIPICVITAQSEIEPFSVKTSHL